LDGRKKYMADARKFKKDYNKKMGFIIEHTLEHSTERNFKIAELNRDYEQLFWADPKLTHNPPWLERKDPNIYFKASAWYAVAYTEAQKNRKSFPWGIQSVRALLNEIKVQSGCHNTGQASISINPEMFAYFSLHFNEKLWSTQGNGAEKEG